MSSATFLKQLGIISLLTAALLFWVNQFPVLAEHAILSWSIFLFFVVLCFLIFSLSKKAVKSKNKHQFTNVFLIFLTIKLLFSAGIILGYAKVVEPSSKLFVAPFFGLYLIYTIFEVYFLIRLANE